MDRVRNSIKGLNKENQNETLLEINSHIYEAFISSGKGELESILDATENLGNPEVFLKELVAEKSLDEAAATFHPLKIFKALLLNLSNGFSYVLFFILYLFLFAFIGLIVMEIFMPDRVGIFYKPDRVFVIGMTTSQYEKYEVTGAWFIPLMIVSTIVSYLLITLLLKFKRTINK